MAIQGGAGHPMAWTAQDLDEANPQVVEVNEQDVTELEEALANFKTLGLGPDAVTRATFPLPALQARLAEASLDVHQGRGFAIVRGLDPRKYADEDNVTIFLAIASHIGEQRGLQDKKGSMLTHVTDSKPWHCDMGADILALHVRSLAETGGDTFVASSWTIYKELAASYPEALAALCDPSWPIQVSGNPPRYILAPLLHVSEDKIMASLDPGRLGLHPATARTGQGSPVPDLSPLQHEALEVLSMLASKYRYRLDMKQGDMIFINNLALLHARDSYVDPKTGPGRHLVRLWLRNPEHAWAIPESMKVPWEAAFGPEGNGFPDVQKKYPVHPAPVYKPPTYTAGSAAFIIEDSENVNSEYST
ncbi:uncharacterized protein THITE_2042740 [Thermothielavioides terrestris NRRL 8126]|uniref:TauD/TfdA-like domain-containing protein n=1 Tax=Thermothielavioides terrestris (strain ATCC 38088 / NRRL 8126) TaxID=578455 RepID=G2QXF1_THETT|nr:uncharacterized protein THITE_2042740 [Thermothielavioides terrestris NRRL 8126]AEO63174.1 hypothetical protein THITE_2042740 [Thermothielavioides terrestris NRRL 8126]